MGRSDFCMVRSDFDYGAKMTFGWGKVTGGEMTMGRNDRNSIVAVSAVTSNRTASHSVG